LSRFFDLGRLIPIFILGYASHSFSLGQLISTSILGQLGSTIQPWMTRLNLRSGPTYSTFTLGQFISTFNLTQLSLTFIPCQLVSIIRPGSTHLNLHIKLGELSLIFLAGPTQVNYGPVMTQPSTHVIFPRALVWVNLA